MTSISRSFFDTTAEAALLSMTDAQPNIVCYARGVKGHGFGSGSPKDGMGTLGHNRVICEGTLSGKMFADRLVPTGHSQ